ncbi:MAG: ABC transporter permease [Planctomycetes bacterium]|nr:ABC transporter permease [Planctomycetota bacterium]
MMSTGYRIVILGFRSLRAHILRSVLTMLGILFGVGSVIAMLAFGEGTAQEAQEQLKALGSTNIILKSKKPTDTGNQAAGNEASVRFGLRYDDALLISETVPDVKVTVPARDYPKKVQFETRQADAVIRGTVPWFPKVSNLRMIDGAFFGDIHTRDHANVCVLTKEIARSLFSFEYPVGKTIKIDYDPYIVIGVIEEKTGVKKADGGETETNRNIIYIPITSSRVYLGEQIVSRTSGSFIREDVELHEIQVQAREIDDVLPVAASVKRVIEHAHKDKDYDIVVPLELIETQRKQSALFKVFLALIASISLLVGGIGIMNIMLASVTERTREIGIRRALGARKEHIVAQFLVETVTLSSLGGALGVLVGVFTPWIVEVTMHKPAIVRMDSVLLSFSVSALVGIVFGLYPAVRAAGLDPIEALRHE